MLKQIYDFAITKNLASDNRYKEKYVKYHINLTQDGKVIGILITENKHDKIVCPVYPDRKLYGNTANFLVEKASVILDKDNKKFASFYDDIDAASASGVDIIVPIKLFFDIVHDEAEYNDVLSLADSSDLIGFAVDGYLVENTDGWKSYFEKKYADFMAEDAESGKSNEMMVSVVSGEVIDPIMLTDKVIVGGATTGTGDVIICCDKPAYQSYGLDCALNGAISKHESETLKLGLEYLLANNFNRDWGLIHWYDKDINLDIIQSMLTPDSLFADLDLDSFDIDSVEDKDVKIYNFLKELTKNGRLSQDASDLSDVNYYLLNYKPCSGRIAFSGFRTGNFNELFNNLMQFYKDTEMLKRYKPKDATVWKEATIPIFNIYSIFINCLNSYVPATKRFEQAKKEFGLIKKQQLFNAIIEQKQIPSDYLHRAVAQIKRYKVKGETPPFTLYQLLKAYINRNHRMKGEQEPIMATLNSENKDMAYNLGRLFAVYGKIQEDALGNVNASIVDKYYNAASTSPAYVFGRLASLSKHHLAKIKNTGSVIYYKKLLQEISANIESFPKTLSIYEQANFSLGYYQQEQSFYIKKENNLENKESNENE